MIVGVPKETFPAERRVALTPSVIPSLTKAALEIVMETGAGTAAGFLDTTYSNQGAKIATSRAEVFAVADIILQVRTLGANREAGRTDPALFRAGQIVIGFTEAFTALEAVQELSFRRVTVFAMELIPRISRAQRMDALSAMATIAGYKAVLLAAEHLPKMFPMLITAAGTIAPARVFVVGAGVAGLQAIATARRLGATVEAFDIRPTVKEEVLSVGAKFVELSLEIANTEDAGGYAKAQGESFYRRQQELMTHVVAHSDVVITTAAVPGKKAPVLLSAEMVAGMAPGSVIVDLAAERGGNCALTRPDETVNAYGVTILGPTNLPATVPFHASQMYAKTMTAFLLHLLKNGNLRLDMADPIIRETLMMRDGEIVHPQIQKALGSPLRMEEVGGGR